ncbi:MAG: hypothetical protein IT513_00050 [Burkholderiales bacterium]|nr:hypothetical protein [Burkholderiales bacterium]
MSSLSLLRSLRLSYLPPLMVYVAAGIQGLTGIVGTFFIKEYLDLSAEFLAALGFWTVLPYTIKMVAGHVVDLVWRWKEALVFLGAALLAAGVGIMIGLLADPAAMRAVMPAEHWFVLASLLAPVGYMIQDVVADAMTVEAVPRVEADGRPIPEEERRAMHTTMQTLGRVAIIGGLTLVSLLNVFLMAGVHQLPEPQKIAAYLRVYQWALVIPAVSVSGVLLAAWLRHRSPLQFRREVAPPPANWWILGGGALFAGVSIVVGLGRYRYGQEFVFAASMVVVLFLIWRLARELDAAARATLIGTAAVIWVFRAVPGPGAGASWWMIDVLKFDQQFLAQLSLVSSALTLAALFVFRRFMAERSIYYIVGFLTVAGTLLTLPQLGMVYGLHEWTAGRTGGIVDARFIALVDTALESPLGQIAMVPMLAWIAASAPERLKATYFAVMASFTNLALSASQLGTKYLNHAFTVSREVRDAGTGAVKVPADYGELGPLFVTVTLIALLLPLATISLARLARMRSA